MITNIVPTLKTLSYNSLSQTEKIAFLSLLTKTKLGGVPYTLCDGLQTVVTMFSRVQNRQ